MHKINGKNIVAVAAIDVIKDQLIPQMVIGVGTGSTVNCFIQQLAQLRGHFAGAVASSEATAILLQQARIPLFELNDVHQVPFYIDGADQFNSDRILIKGGGGALTREKIIAHMADCFICIVEAHKQVDALNFTFPLPLEVIPMARSAVARQLVAMGGVPRYRVGFLSDNGNRILDVRIPIDIAMEDRLNSIPGIVENGLFAQRRPEQLLIVDNAGKVASLLP